MDQSKNGPQYLLKFGTSNILINKKKFKLLKFIDECGSIMKASENTGIPYRSALKYIDELEKETEERVVTTKRGGRGGGGESKLTDYGKTILKEYRKVESILKMHDKVNEIESNITEIDFEKKTANININDKKIILPLRGNFNIGDRVLILISPEDIFVMLKPQESSVRNIFPGNIIGMELKDHLVRLKVDLGDFSLFVDVTEQAREHLKLTVGKDVFIGFKAASIAMVKL